ncbi:MAG TPA: carboxypeptidase-like regulatory domain-containing protein [Candidatus Rubrimentiphilum sp.]|nr:carboxypeptidase-like regulatory domain-containing protein [Candidatus Rubrimentiphilum sp.]
MKRALGIPALLLTLAAVPAPLVVGSVRDQEGAPIVGASIAAGTVQTTTAPDGTFALEAGGVRSLRITCSYCKPLVVAVQDAEPVVAIVQRYGALSESSPSARDLRSLPYSRPESAASLHPFVVLTDSRAFLPGPRLADRAASAQGGAVIDDGIPDYDIAANVSMLPVIPSFDLRSADMFAPGQTSYTGDQAAGGVFFLNDIPAQGSDASLAGGSDYAARRGIFTPNAAFAFAASGNKGANSARGAAQLHVPVGIDSLDLSFLGASAGVTRSSVWSREAIEGFRAQYSRVRDTALQATFVADRAGYATSFASAPLSSTWSDLVGDLTVSSQTPVQIFGDAGMRRSTGLYDADAFHLRIAGSVTQTHFDAGAQTSGPGYSARATVGVYAIAYNGGTGVALPLQAQALAPSLYASYALSPRWNVELYAGTSFRLPALLEAYGTKPDPDLHVDRYAELTQTLTYSDLNRLKISMTYMSEQLSSLDAGTVHSAGASIAWQIAPEISLRAWTMWFNDTTQPYENILRFGRSAPTGTPGSLWLTYENSGGFRIDTIYRSDFLDALPRRHVDASLSGPLHGAMRWFLGTERLQDVRTVDAGIKFEQP